MKNNIEVEWFNYDYLEQSDINIPVGNLSIIDTLMNYGLDKSKFLRCYKIMKKRFRDKTKIFQKNFQISESKILSAKINHILKWILNTYKSHFRDWEKISNKKINNKDIANLNSFKNSSVFKK